MSIVRIILKMMSIIFKQNNCNARALVEFQNKCITNLYRILINSSKEKATLYTFSSSAVTQLFGGGQTGNGWIHRHTCTPGLCTYTLVCATSPLYFYTSFTVLELYFSCRDQQRITFKNNCLLQHLFNWENKRAIEFTLEYGSDCQPWHWLTQNIVCKK